MNLEQYHSKDATHELFCTHKCCRNATRYYTTKCIPISKTKSGKIKIVVFGDKFWGPDDRHKRIRYVLPQKIKKIESNDIAKDIYNELGFELPEELKKHEFRQLSEIMKEREAQ